MQTTAELQALLDKYLADRMTGPERLRLKHLLEDPSNSDHLASVVEMVLQEHRYSETSGVDKDQLFAQLMQRSRVTAVERPQTAHRVHFLRRRWFHYAAAVVIAVSLGTIAYLVTLQKNHSQSLVSGNQHLPNNIPPGGEKAVLTLADGSKIILDDAGNGALANQGGVQIVKLANGRIAYDAKALTDKGLMWNTMSTPVGGQYQVTLPDGTKVWLNAASSITFPTTFTGPTREVKMNGEVYFEVAKNLQKPFVVQVDGKSIVQVLGTSFNVNSYTDEGNIKTTLVEGSVKVTKDNKAIVLQPGYQAVVASNIQTQVVDLEHVLAWKNGLFSFKDSDIRTVMRQLERWYGITVRFEGAAADFSFQGKMYRNVPLADVLEVLQRMGVTFRMEGKTLIVQ